MGLPEHSTLERCTIGKIFTVQHLVVSTSMPHLTIHLYIRIHTCIMLLPSVGSNLTVLRRGSMGRGSRTLYHYSLSLRNSPGNKYSLWVAMEWYQPTRSSAQSNLDRGFMVIPIFVPSSSSARLLLSPRTAPRTSIARKRHRKSRQSKSVVP